MFYTSLYGMFLKSFLFPLIIILHSAFSCLWLHCQFSRTVTASLGCAQNFYLFCSMPTTNTSILLLSWFWWQLPHHATSICIYTLVVLLTTKTKLFCPGSTHSNSIAIRLIVECGSMEGEKPPPNLTRSPPRRAKIWTSKKASMKRLCWGSNGGIFTIKINIHFLNFHFPCFAWWWLHCNKNFMEKTIPFM